MRVSFFKFLFPVTHHRTLLQMKLRTATLILAGLCAGSQAFVAPRPSVLRSRASSSTSSVLPPSFVLSQGPLGASSLEEFETEYAKSLSPEWWGDLAKSSLDCEYNSSVLMQVRLFAR